MDSVYFLLGFRWYTRDMNSAPELFGMISVSSSNVIFKLPWPEWPVVGSHIVLIGIVLPPPWPTNPQAASTGVSNPPFGIKFPFVGAESSITVGYIRLTA